MTKRREVKLRDPPRVSHYVGEVERPLLRQAIPYVEFPLSSPKPFQQGILTRLSCRWFKYWETKKFPIPVPFIDHVGKFTIHRLGVWYTYPEVWFASVVATVNDRLLRLYIRRAQNSRVDQSIRNLIFKIAVFYTYSHNGYAMDRFLANLHPNRIRVVRSLYRCFVSKLGANFRFVYNQANFQASWFSFRSRWIRAKPQDNTTLLSSSVLAYKPKKKRKFSFVNYNPFVNSLNWLKQVGW